MSTTESLSPLLQRRPESIPKTYRGSRSSSLPGNHFLLPRGHLSMRERGEWRSGEERRREEEETQTETADEMRHDIQRDSPGQTPESFYLSSSCRYLQLGLALKIQIFALTFLSFFELPEGGCSCHSLSHPGPKVHILSSDGTDIDTIFIYRRDRGQTTTLPLSFFRRL